MRVLFAHVIRVVFIMCKDMFDEIRGSFASGIMGLTETVQRDIIPIEDLVLLYYVVKQELGFPLDD